MQYLGYYYTKTFSLVYLKFKFNCIAFSFYLLNLAILLLSFKEICLTFR